MAAVFQWARGYNVRLAQEAISLKLTTHHRQKLLGLAGKSGRSVEEVAMYLLHSALARVVSNG